MFHCEQESRTAIPKAVNDIILFRKNVCSLPHTGPAAFSPGGETNQDPSLLEDNEAQSGSILSLTLANRSAALFRLGLYEECLRDISEAISMGYPANLEHKLRERAGSCYLNTGDVNKAETEFKAALELLNAGQIRGDAKQEKAIHQYRKNLEEKLARVQTEKKVVALAQPTKSKILWEKKSPNQIMKIANFCKLCYEVQRFHSKRWIQLKLVTITIRLKFIHCFFYIVEFSWYYIFFLYFYLTIYSINIHHDILIERSQKLQITHEVLDCKVLILDSSKRGRRRRSSTTRPEGWNK